MEDIKVRQDSWSHEDDLMLAETVLRHIREGSTQLRAFEEVGDRLNRTAAACGFRWNAEIRRKYDKAIEIAKKQRKERKRALAQKMQSTSYPVNEEQEQILDDIDEEVPNYEVVSELKTNKEANERDERTSNFEESEISLKDVISFLQQLNEKNSNSVYLKNENERLNKEKNRLKRQTDELENRLKRIQKKHAMMQEDYQALIQIMDRARKMVMFDDAALHQSNNNSDYEQLAE
jgi:prespore-specific regulator